ncbi:MAG: Uma2 family endonuclease [Gomphosphaeria aponina SAG 52.96 = DSM 107014]|uniref:Uma2 family endonuclease n=1 Tax=Gomphosphaeria aponina SAG 52.96 = DSM 107014 TaxID=1521640 RepID=A0A941JLX5_9CHRO|nr:Uma2 family endonuclease [Gomphosphaeria aponina SAG 52.96 = DSM 107014]
MGQITIKDLEKVEATFKEAGYDYQLELDNGKILVMSPSDIISSEIGSVFIRLLGNWVYPRRLGRVFDSSGGFIMPDSNLKAPDVSFVRAERIPRSVRYFGELVPDLVVEIKSQSDRIKTLEEKIQMFLSMNAQVAILIDPDKNTVTVYRAEGEPLVLKDGDILTIPELFPGWELPISEIWPVEF